MATASIQHGRPGGQEAQKRCRSEERAVWAGAGARVGAVTIGAGSEGAGTRGGTDTAAVSRTDGAE